MARALCNDRVLAESGRTIIVEGNHYFPPESVRREYFAASDTHTPCPWKGEASSFSIKADGKLNTGALWYYPNPSEAARKLGIKDC